jgi:leishmanolysin
MAGEAGVTEADYIMKVTAWPTQGSVAAWASNCLVDQFGRPIAGHMNIGPNAMGSSSDANLLVVMTHEMLHALGFASYRFDNFMNPSGQLYVPVKQTTLGSGSKTKRAWLLNSPRVVEAAREYFDCPTLEGLELEDNLEDGKPGSHWDERNLREEIMTPVADYGFGEPRISKMTLAVFHDMGVYFPNYAKARDSAYGKGQGCDFVNQPPSQRGDG